MLNQHCSLILLLDHYPPPWHYYTMLICFDHIHYLAYLIPFSYLSLVIPFNGYIGFFTFLYVTTYVPKKCKIIHHNYYYTLGVTLGVLTVVSSHRQAVEYPPISH